ncbi:MAG: histone deacetylase [Bacteroidetes bacterium]|nr:histone deacetylase [Rhodothermia bacterium]MCS7154734.1 histone deacetylase [Bacteroidota bacterium]MCX7907109.1 histone deacetylase [Bacteroidota bacterium]MDW8137527.1 histone deacetylase [Bacteroidota bacterium]MDW8285519.1 histone deacetylase [Bacteroidota bacterium]
MRVYYSDPYELPLPPGHRFPAGKYRMLRQRLLACGLVREAELALAPMADWDVLARAHSPTYLAAVRFGGLSQAQQRQIGFPWSPELVRRSRASVGGTLQAVRTALEAGIAGNLAGGTHHAFADRGAGFCVFNDLAVSALEALAQGWVRRVAVLDLDVHQGDGTAALLRGRPGLWTASVHAQANYPFRKVPSDLDVGLPDGTEDAPYLEVVQAVLRKLERFRPDLVLYQAGVDSLREDRLGRLALSLEGLAKRDELVLSWARRLKVPIALTLGGGYAEPMERTVEAHLQTYRIARELFG